MHEEGSGEMEGLNQCSFVVDVEVFIVPVDD